MIGSRTRRAGGQRGATALWRLPMRPVTGSSVRSASDRSTSIGYWVVPAERRRGVATHAVRLLGHWALRRLSLRRLELYHFVGNDVSGQVAEKVGFQREGVLRAYVVMRGEPRDCVMYSLLASDIETVGTR